nr:MAG TPA: hypothetical protein [Caudoviricetes sp.]
MSWFKLLWALKIGDSHLMLASLLSRFGGYFYV